MAVALTPRIYKRAGRVEEVEVVPRIRIAGFPTIMVTSHDFQIVDVSLERAAPCLRRGLSIGEI